MSKMSHWFTQTFIVKEKVNKTDWTPETYDVVGFFKGFKQPVSSSTTFANGKDTMLISHIIFSEIKAQVSPGNVLTYDGKSYLVRAIQPGGISGIDDHMEIGVEFIDGNEY